MIPKTYAKPPIVEAMIEVRFAPGADWTDETLAALEASFKRDYPGPTQRRNNVQLQARIDGDTVTTDSSLSLQQLMLPSDDGKALVGIGSNVLSAHVLAPYPGWTSFLPRVCSALSLYEQIAKPSGLTLVAVRYIDQIALPPGDANLIEYFTCLPARPGAMPPILEAFQVATQARDTVDDFVAVLALASIPSDGPSVNVLYDLNLVRTFPVVAASLKEFEKHANFLHTRQRAIYEDSITDKMRGLFA